MINSFRDPNPTITCATCGKPLEGIPMDKGDFLYVYEDHQHPHSIFPRQEATDA